VDRQAGGVAEQPTDGDGLGLEGRRRGTPASQVADHRLVQADPALLDQAQHPQAVTGFETEAAWKRVAGVTGCPFAWSATP
jgi:hypothetical protein